MRARDGVGAEGEQVGHRHTAEVAGAHARRLAAHLALLAALEGHAQPVAADVKDQQRAHHLDAPRPLHLRQPGHVLVEPRHADGLDGAVLALEARLEQRVQVLGAGNEVAQARALDQAARLLELLLRDVHEVVVRLSPRSAT